MNRRAGDELADVLTRKDPVLEDLAELARQLPLEELPTYLGRLEAARWTAVFRAAPAPRPEPKRERLLTVDQVAELLQISRDAVYRRSRSDLRPAVVELGQGGSRGTIRFDPVALDRFIRVRKRV